MVEAQVCGSAVFMHLSSSAYPALSQHVINCDVKHFIARVAKISNLLLDVTAAQLHTY